MNRWLTLFVSIFVSLSLFFSTSFTFAKESTQVSTDEQTPYVLSEYEKQVIELVNKERAKRNLKPLITDVKVSEYSREKSEEMRDKDYFDHISPTHGHPCKRMNKKYCGENIARGNKTPEDVMKAWMNSTGHRNNILNDQYTHIGVGYAEGGRYGTYWTQQFYKEQ